MTGPAEPRPDRAADGSVGSVLTDGVRSGRRRWQQLLVVGVLYLVSNIGYTFFFIGLSTILLGRGVALGTVATINLLGIVYSGRFLLAPLVDRVGWRRLGQYRSWILLTQVGLIAALVALAPLDPVADLPVIVALMLAVLVLSAFHDTALNGLAVRMLDPAEHGVANGVQVGGASLSIMVGSGGALMLYAHAGWTVTVLALAAVFVVPLLVLARLDEPPAGPSVPKDGPALARAPWHALVDFVRQRRLVVWTLMIVPLFGIAEWLGTAPQAAMMLRVGWSTERIATIQLVATAVQVVAALAAGLAITRYGRSPTAAVFGVVGVLALSGLLPLAIGQGGVPTTVAAVIAVSAVYGAKVTWFATISMRLARRPTAATDYSVPMSVEGAAVTAVNSAGLALAGVVGFVWLLGAAVAFAVAGTWLATRWSARNT